MRRKNGILAGILATGIVLIVLVKQYLQHDARQVQNIQIQFFTEHLSAQKNYILNSLENTATFAFQQRNALPGQTVLANNPVKSTNAFFHDLNERGFSFSGILNADSSLMVQTDHPALDISDCLSFRKLYQDFSNSDWKTFPRKGCIICDQQLGFVYGYPMRYDSLRQRYSDFFVAGFPLQALLQKIEHNPDPVAMGFVVLPDDPESSRKVLASKGFYPLSGIEGLWIDSSFEIPFDLEKKGTFRQQLQEKLKRAVQDPSDKDFSIYLPTQTKPGILTFSEMSMMEPKGSIFLVSHNRDLILEKTFDWNRQIFVINVIIIILITFGVAYLLIGRIKVEKEKSRIAESEQKLLELNRSKDKFFSILAHDLKNPFNGILGMSTYLNEYFPSLSDEKRQEIIGEINSASKNAFNLLQNLLEWTRTQSGQIKNIPAEIEPQTIIEIALETVASLAKNKQIEIVRIYQTRACGWADENLVATVLRNLFTNAVKFSPRHSTVVVLVKEFGEELVFCIKDQGIGLKSEEIDQLFRIDVNFHKKGTEQETGTGLGLKICKEFADYCQGRIWVVSEYEKGSSFYFTIPLVSNSAGAEPG